MFLHQVNQPEEPAGENCVETVHNIQVLILLFRIYMFSISFFLHQCHFPYSTNIHFKDPNPLKKFKQTSWESSP